MISFVRFDFQNPSVAPTLDVNILFNLTKIDSQLKNGAIPWRGGREKDSLLIQIFVI